MVHSSTLPYPWANIKVPSTVITKLRNYENGVEFHQQFIGTAGKDVCSAGITSALLRGVASEPNRR